MQSLVVADLAGSDPPLGRQTDAVTHAIILNFERSTVKHDAQNIQNDCHQWFADSFIVHQIRFRPRLRPEPHWGSSSSAPDTAGGAYGAPPDFIAGLRGPNSKWRGERKGEKERRRGEEGNGRDRPPFHKFLDPPMVGDGKP